VTLLGTSCGVPTRERGLPAVAVRREREIILFDCGEGTQRQMLRFGLSFMRIRRIFITHFHGDHYLGLFGLVQSMSFFGRTEVLDLYGPRGMERIAEILGSIGNFAPAYAIAGHELESGEVVKGEGYRVLAQGVAHTVPTLGYRLEEDERPGKFDLEKARSLGIPPGILYNELQSGKTIRWKGREISPKEVVGPRRPGRSLVYLGDVLATKALLPLCRGSDLMISEATFCEDLAERARLTGHSTVKQVCEVARMAGVKRLLLTHFSPRYDKEAMAGEADFQSTVIGEDGLTIDIPYP